jgi:hypothetical protein
MKIRLLGLTVIIAAYFGWYVYQRAGWDFILTLQVIYFACFGTGILLSSLLRDRFSRNGEEPAFPLIVVFVVSFFVVTIISAPIDLPLSKGFDLEDWNENFLLVLFGWFSWHFSMGTFIFAIARPNQKMKEDAVK